MASLTVRIKFQPSAWKAQRSDFQSLLGQSVRGALKSVTVGVSVASVVAILLILPMSLLF
ncbi:hypothetical protein ACIQTW_16540 [Paenarthrobacter sp. NPDC090517]|uniref:hypothetical protein n=1 Tax=Paenarthrobacter sp. NPDC090517 TaxID=3364381 RepID=UPI00381093C8